METISVNSLENTCRTCMCENVCLKSLFVNFGNSSSLQDVLYFVTNINVNSNDNLPKQICSDCEVSLYEFERFKRRCIESEITLHKLYTKSSTEAESLSSIKNENNTSPFQCSLCLLQFAEVLDLHNHVISSHETKKEVEKLLHNTGVEILFEPVLSLKPSLKTNVKEEVVDSPDFVDDNSSEDFNLKDLAEQKLEESKKKKVKKISKDITYTCEFCDIKYNTRKSYRRHVRTKHEPPKPKTSLIEEEIKPKNEPRPKLHECSECMRRFVKKSTLIAHIKRHQTTQSHICSICKREFKHKAHLENHILSLHSAAEGLNCPICNKSFPNQESLDLHKTRHNDKKLHKCDVCAKEFNMLSSLKDHMRVHTGEKPYLCPTCGKGFTQNTNLLDHIRRHQGIKPFKCNMCDRGFVSKGELSAHLRKHSGAHPFVCTECNNGFTTSSSLRKHQRLHTGERPYACDLCPLRFAASGTLVNHRRTHTGEKPYKCTHCDKAFVQKNDLVSHIRCHTGERPYVCSTCGQGFRQSSALKTHQKMHQMKSEFVRKEQRFLRENEMMQPILNPNVRMLGQSVDMS